MNQHDPGCPDSMGHFSKERGSHADEQQGFRARRTEPTGVTQMRGHLPSLLDARISFYGSFRSCRQPLQREQGCSERQYKYHTLPLASREPLSQANQVSKKMDKYLLRKALPGLARVQAGG